MIKNWLKKYFAIVFLFATLLGGMHHHNDLKQHNDCKICVIQSTMLDADTPAIVHYIDEIALYAQTPVTFFANFILDTHTTTLKARAPPQFS